MDLKTEEIEIKLNADRNQRMQFSVNGKINVIDIWNLGDFSHKDHQTIANLVSKSAELFTQLKSLTSLVDVGFTEADNTYQEWEDKLKKEIKESKSLLQSLSNN